MEIVRRARAPLLAVIVVISFGCTGKSNVSPADSALLADIRDAVRTRDIEKLTQLRAQPIINILDELIGDYQKATHWPTRDAIVLLFHDLDDPRLKPVMRHAMSSPSIETQLTAMAHLTDARKVYDKMLADFAKEGPGDPAAMAISDIFRGLAVYSEDDYRNLPRRDRYVWDVNWFETEVMNGGMDQYLGNMGDHAIECLEALKEIGAVHSYRSLKQACDLLPDGRPAKSQEIRHAQLRKLRMVKHVESVDDLLDEGLDENLMQLLLDYYRNANPNVK